MFHQYTGTALALPQKKKGGGREGEREGSQGSLLVHFKVHSHFLWTGNGASTLKCNCARVTNNLLFLLETPGTRGHTHTLGNYFKCSPAHPLSRPLPHTDASSPGGAGTEIQVLLRLSFFAAPLLPRPPDVSGFPPGPGSSCSLEDTHGGVPETPEM